MSNQYREASLSDFLMLLRAADFFGLSGQPRIGHPRISLGRKPRDPNQNARKRRTSDFHSAISPGLSFCDMMI